MLRQGVASALFKGFQASRATPVAAEIGARAMASTSDGPITATLFPGDGAWERGSGRGMAHRVLRNECWIL